MSTTTHLSPKLTLVVLAAGAGSRYGGLKQIDPVGPSGELIIDYSIYDALKAGFTQVLFVINRKIDAAFREAIGRRIERQIQTGYVYQDLDDLPEGYKLPPSRQKPWGTAHAVMAAREVVDSPFAVINADDYYGQNSYQLLADHLTAADAAGLVDASMVGFRLANTVSEHGYVSRGVCRVDRGGCLLDIDERTRIERRPEGIQYLDDQSGLWVDLADDTVVSMNLWGFGPQILPQLTTRFGSFLERSAANIDTAEYFLPGVVKEMIADGTTQVKVLSTDDQWYGVTYQQDKPRVKASMARLVEQGIYPAALWSR